MKLNIKVEMEAYKQEAKQGYPGDSIAVPGYESSASLTGTVPRCRECKWKLEEKNE